MKETNTFVDIVIPKNNESEFVDIAKRLNIHHLCFLYDTKVFLEKKKIIEGLNKKNKDIKLYAGIKLSNTNRILNIKHKLKPDLILSDKADRSKIRKGIDIIFNVEQAEKDFLRYRNSGLDFVKAKMFVENDIIYAISLSQMIASQEKTERPKLIARMIQNVKIARKKKLNITFASFANNPMQLRGISDIVAFATSLGFSTQQIKLAKKIVYERLKLNEKFNKGLIVEKGVEKLAEGEFNNYLKRLKS